MKKNRAIINFLIFMVLPSIIFISFVNLTLPHHLFDDFEKKVWSAVSRREYSWLRSVFLDKIKKDFKNIDYHRKYLRYHFEVAPTGTKPYRYNHPKIFKKYKDMGKNSESFEVRSIANYIVGFLYVLREEYEEGYQFYQKVENRVQKFLNNSIGFLLFKSEDVKYNPNAQNGTLASLKMDERERLAEKYFFYEIAINGHKEAAFSNLSKIYYKNKKYKQLCQLRSDFDEADKEIPAKYIKFCYIKDGNILAYTTLGFIKEIEKLEPFGLIASFMVMFIFLTYFLIIGKNLNLKKGLISKLLLYGVISSLFAIIFYDFFDYLFHFKMGKSEIQKFIFSIIGIGFIEEIIKVIPLFIIFRGKKEGVNSYKILIYTPIVVLGFIFLENFFYFDKFGIKKIFIRTTTVGYLHIILTSILALNWFGKNKKRDLLSKLKILSIVAVIHGIYDYFIVAENYLYTYGILPMGIVLIIVKWYGSTFKNNLLSDNLYQNKNFIIDIRESSEYLFYGTFFIFIFNFWVLYTHSDIDFGNNFLYMGIIKLIFGLSICEILRREISLKPLLKTET